jgi:hypothetical protein
VEGKEDLNEMEGLDVGCMESDTKQNKFKILIY